MTTSFDQMIDRKGSGSVKWERMSPRASRPDALPMWVADGDYPSPQPVIEALQNRAAHPIYGYAYVKPQFSQVTANWMATHHNWQVDPQWVTFCPGVVPALSMAIFTLTQPGDQILIQRPVYHPFTNITRDLGRNIISNTLLLKDGRYEIDFADFEAKAADPKTTLMLLCNPHNPTGRVLTREELTTMGDICHRHGVTIVSDEIHADLVFPGHTHVPMASLDTPWASKIITCHAPSKTFNIAGLQASAIIIPDDDLRATFRRALAAFHIDGPNAFAMDGYITAYDQCADYVTQQLAYLEGNLACFSDFLAQHMPKIKLIAPQGTYLLWLDCRELFGQDEQVQDFFMQSANIAINPGSLFGAEGNCFVRLNMACPRTTLMQGLERLKTAYQALGL